MRATWACRVMVLAAAGVLSAGAILAAAFAFLADTAEDQERIGRHVYPAFAALRDVKVGALEAQAAFMQMTRTTTDADRLVAIASAQDARTGMDRAWADYRRHALGLPGERSLQTAYAEALARGNELGVTIVSTSATAPGYPSLVTAEQAASRDQIAAIDEIDTMIYAPLVAGTTTHILGDIDEARSRLLYLATPVILGYSALALVFARGLRREQRAVATEAQRMREVGDQVEFEATVQRGLEMAHTEEAVFAVAERALKTVAGTGDVEVLMTSGNGRQLRTVLVVGGGKGCACNDPSDCPAASGGQVTVSKDNRAIDACPFLDTTDGRAVRATCIPVSYAGTVAGVIHAEDEIDSQRNGLLVERLQILARRMGERVGGLRLLTQSERQARTDSLTGLANRRSLDIAIQEMQLRGLTRYTVGYADLDFFKVLNDTAGHDAGDRALALFARVLRETTRPGDIVARYGGEEFVMVLPDCDLLDATAVAERIRANLAAAIEHSDLPPFTVTVGLAGAHKGEPFENVVKRADAALIAGKNGGRDRVVVAEQAVPEGALDGVR